MAQQRLVERRLEADLRSPLGAYLAVAGLPRPFLLESVERGERLGRYSFLGADPSAVVRLMGGQVVVEERDSLLAGGHGGLLSRVTRPAGELEEVLRRLKGPDMPLPEGCPPFSGGLVGYLGYETAALYERLPTPLPADLPFPLAELGLYRTVAAFDHVRQELRLLSWAGPRALDALAERLQAPAAPAVARETSSGPLECSLSREAFLARTKRVLQHIRKGDIYQLVLSQRFSRPCDGIPPLAIYRALRRLNPSPYLFFLETEAGSLIGSSPERMVRLEGERASMRPIAGTRPRGGSAEEDRALEEELLADEKELAEHAMLVDLGRNDVGRVAAYGTVRVTADKVIERYSHVQHIVSEVRGRLREGLDAVDALRAAFPAGTVTGAPKVRAMEILDALEPTRRGPYAGAVGYLGWGAATMDTAIAIRTAVLAGGRVHVQAGAGIVADSRPEREYAETESKAGAVLRAIALAQASVR